MWIENSFYKYAVAILLVLAILLLLYYTAPMFYPVVWLVVAVILPLLFSTLLYYVLSPVVRFLERWVSRFFAIIIVYLGVAIFGVVCTFFVLPLIEETASRISQTKVESVGLIATSLMEKFKSYIPSSNLPLIENVLATYTPKINSLIYSWIANLVSTLTNITIALVLTPFVLFYFLRDDKLFSKAVLRYVPSQFRMEIEGILSDINKALSGFIVAQLMVASIVGAFLLLGYLLIGLPNAFPLAVVALVFYIIPIVGTLIAIIPALIVAASVSFSMVVSVILLTILAHLLESNFLTPKLVSHVAL